MSALDWVGTDEADDACDLALRLGVTSVIEGFDVVPDVKVIESYANGHELPASWSRTIPEQGRPDDGRRAWFFHLDGSPITEPANPNGMPQ